MREEDRLLPAVVLEEELFNALRLDDDKDGSRGDFKEEDKVEEEEEEKEEEEEEEEEEEGVPFLGGIDAGMEERVGLEVDLELERSEDEWLLI